jgi:hypothetical protein
MPGIVRLHSCSYKGLTCHLASEFLAISCQGNNPETTYIYLQKAIRQLYQYNIKPANRNEIVFKSFRAI